MANGFSTFKQDHHYASGIILMVIGVVGVVASVGGNLGNVLAALFDPSILHSAPGATQSVTIPAADTGTGTSQTVQATPSSPTKTGI